MKKAGASVYADAPVVDQFVDELTINPASWVIYHLFDLKLVFLGRHDLHQPGRDRKEQRGPAADRTRTFRDSRRRL